MANSTRFIENDGKIVSKARYRKEDKKKEDGSIMAFMVIIVDHCIQSD